jgi:glycosyltransferase involved in cell wall biosynthesis
MKIAFFHELHSGGARRASNELARVLRDKNTVDLFFVDELPEKKEEIFYNHVYYFSFLSKKWKGKDSKARVYRDTFELIALNKLHKEIAYQIDQANYDVILVFPSKLTQAPFVLKYLKTKTVYFAMEPLRIVYDSTNKIPENLDVFRYIYEWINRLSRKVIDKSNINAANMIIAPSKYSAEFSSRVYKKKIDIAYLGINSQFFTRKKVKREFDILFVGSKDAVNGYEFFKEVIKNVKTKTTNREVLFENEWLNDIQIRDLYRKTKILVATSYKELLGLIPLEAMSCGVVTLAVDEAGYRETIINKKNGFLITRNAKAFAEKIDFLLNNNNLLNDMSDYAAHNASELWDWKIRGKELENLLKKY